MKKFFMYYFLTIFVCLSVFFYVLYCTGIPGRILTRNIDVYEEGYVYDTIWESYDELPKIVKTMLRENHYRIYVVDLINNNERILGLTMYKASIILIKNETYEVVDTFYHECGHVLDDESCFGYASETKEFEGIYENERYMFVYVSPYNHEYCTSTKQEYFAQAFAEYMTNPDKLKRYTPQTYEYIENCLN